MRQRHLLSILTLLLALLAGGGPLLASAATPKPTPPTQPVTGPGGAEQRYAGVVAVHVGEAPTGTWVFEPSADGESPTADRQPLVIFFHGFTAVDPIVYREWIDHIVRRGATVIYPDYQTINPFGVRPSAYFSNAVDGIRAALDLLDGGRTPPDRSRVVVVGHSAGGILAARYAAEAASIELPIPLAVMPVQPGGCDVCGGFAFLGIPLGDLGEIDPATRLVIVTGDADHVVGMSGADAIWLATGQMDFTRRDDLELRSDAQGEPDLRATHLAPLTGGSGGDIDALDWYGTWKLLDLLTECAFAGLDCEDAQGGTSAQLSMGAWSDGTPVEPIRVVEPTDSSDQ